MQNPNTVETIEEGKGMLPQPQIITEWPPQENLTPPAVVDDNGKSASSIMVIIAKLAENQSVDVDKIEKLMSIFVAETERHEAKIAKDKAEEAKRLFNAAFVKMKPKLPLVLRTKRNTHTNSNYAPLEEVNKTIDPILAQFGFGTSAVVIDQNKEDVTMELSVIHEGGHSMTMRLTMPIDDKGPNGSKNKTTGQGISSTMTTAKRVGFCAMLNISTGDDRDGNANDPVGPQLITTEQATQLDLDIKELDLDRADFLRWVVGEKGEEITDTRTMNVKEYAKANNAIRDIKRKQKKSTTEKKA